MTNTFFTSNLQSQCHLSKHQQHSSFLNTCTQLIVKSNHSIISHPHFLWVRLSIPPAPSFLSGTGKSDLQSHFSWFSYSNSSFSFGLRRVLWYNESAST